MYHSYNNQKTVATMVITIAMTIAKAYMTNIRDLWPTTFRLMDMDHSQVHLRELHSEARSWDRCRDQYIAVLKHFQTLISFFTNQCLGQTLIS